METNTMSVEKLMNKLKLAKEIYKTAASKIHNKPMADELLLVAEKKALNFDELVTQTSLDLYEQEIKLPDLIKLEFQKVEMEINHLLIHRNENDILNFCIEQEKELIQCYVETIIELKKDKVDIVAFVNQLYEAKKLLKSLKETKKAYEFDTHQ